MANVFKTAKQVLSDRSEVFDVVAQVEGEKAYLLWNAPSERSASQCAMTLNDVMEAFARCGSDNEVIRLANQIFEACKQK